MTRTELVSRLLAAPERIADAESNLHAARLSLQTARDEHDDEEARLLIEGVDGRNEAERKANLRDALEQGRRYIRAAECTVLEAERAFNAEVGRFRALRSVAALLAGDAAEPAAVRLAA